MDNDGILIIHRDIPGDHDNIDPVNCWCNPHIITEDTLLTTEQIIDQVSRKEFRQ